MKYEKESLADEIDSLDKKIDIALEKYHRAANLNRGDIDMAQKWSDRKGKWEKRQQEAREELEQVNESLDDIHSDIESFEIEILEVIMKMLSSDQKEEIILFVEL